MRQDATPSTTPRLVFGLLIVAVGVLFTLDNLGLAEVDDLLRYWPVILIAVGVARLWSGVHRAKGVLWIVVGGALLLPVVSDEIEFEDLVNRWPLFLIGLGVYFVWRSFAPRTGGPRAGDRRPGLPRPGVAHPGVPPPGRRQPAEPSPGAEPAANGSASVFSVLSSVKKSVEGRFRRGEATALLGGAELDLRRAELDAEGAVIEVLALWGGIVLRVPEDWPVELEANVLMGASEDNTRPSGRTAAPRLTVRGFVLMGGVEVRS